MSHKEQTSISKHLTKTYMLLFPFFIFIIVVVVVTGTLFGKMWMEDSLPAAEYTAQNLIRPDINEIDIMPVTEHGGSVAVVDLQGHITTLCGNPIFDKSVLTMSEWTDFLASCSDSAGNYTYTVAYEETKDFWLVVGFPSSVRIQFIFTANSNAENFGKSVAFFSILFLLLILLLLVSTFIYARFSAKTFISPLRQLCGTVKRMTRGNYLEEASQQNLSGEFLWLKNDITALADALTEEKTKREQMEQDRKRILLDISHDLRNPLATVMGYAETLCTQDNIDAEESHRYAEIIWKNSIRANARLDDLFTYSKFEHPDFRLCRKQGDICEFMREQISLFYAEFETAGLVTEFSIPEEEILLSFDEVLLARVFANLFTNSIRYNNAGTQLQVSLIKKIDGVQIIIADNGSGMEETMGQTIFEPFTRGDKARNSETGGSGLGLAIAKKIIDAHGGGILLQTAPDKGCVFTIHLR